MTTDRASSNQAFRSPWILGLLALAILLRLFALMLAWGTEPIGDPLNYLRLAHSLLAGDGLSLPRTAIGPERVSTALFPPGLPLVLAAIGLVAPLNAATLFLLNSLIDCTAALLLARLARLLGAPQIAVPAALAYLLWPSIALMSPLAYKEGLVIALLLGTAVCLFEQARRPGLLWALGSGLCAGALLLTQPALATLLPILFLAAASAFPGWRRWLQVSLVAAAAALLAMLPWWVRNALVFGQFIPLTTSGGLAFWEGAHPGGGVVWQLPPKAWNQLGELQAMRAATAEAWRIILADPIGYIARCLAKFPSSFFYSNWAVDQLVNARGQRWPWLGHSLLLRFGPTMVELWVVAMAAIGIVRLRHRITARLLGACVIQVMLFGIWFEFSERHRLFMTPFILLMACELLAGSSRKALR
jgi:4-amino-4-deoxy-L-arabinose transferase-like glycosyltransferase